MKKNRSSKGKKVFSGRGAGAAAEEAPGGAVKSRDEMEIGLELEETETAEPAAATGTEQEQSRVEERKVESRQPVPRYEARPSSGWQQAFADENTILIKRTVRSGQSIQYDGNVVVLGDVNPGSEIIASGNIIVLGALRGVIHAGATGNEDATVAAFKLQPTQLRIANHITRAPDGEYSPPSHPEIARIKDGVVVIELYQMGQDRQSKIC